MSTKAELYCYSIHEQRNFNCFFVSINTDHRTMDFNESKITLAAQFTKQCLLPELDRDIGDQPLEREDFSMYVYGLEQNLRLLFDIIAKNTDALFARTAETEEFRLNFVLLLNEQTGGRNAPFQTLDKSLINQLQSLIRQYYSDVLRDRCIVYGVLDYYKSKVTDRNWKKCIGAVHGYERFCEVLIFHFLSIIETNRD